MKATNRLRVRGTLLGTFVFVLVMLFSGCQGLSPRTSSPTLTPVLLGPQTSTPRPAVTPGAAETGANAPTSETKAQTLPAAITARPTVSSAVAGVIALGNQATIVLRAQAARSAEIVARVPGSQVLRAQGRTRDGSWLWVVYDEAGQHAWVAAEDVKLIGGLAGLVEMSPDFRAISTAGTPQALAVGDVPAARPPLPGVSRPGKVVFQVATGGDIYLVTADGDGLRRLTDGIDPVLSPDSRQVAFARWSAPHGVFVLDLSTGEERRVVSANRPRSPTWSPDGRQLAFVHLVASDVCLDSPFGCLDEATLRARFGGQDCLQTPLGRTCIQDYPRRTVERRGVGLIGVDGTGWLDIAAATDVQAIAWRPGSSEILYRGGGGLQITAADAGPRSLVQDPALGSPAWSPDGTRIAVQVRLHDRTDIFLLDAAGNRLARLTSPAAGAASASHNVAPAWSPDGKSLLFLSDRDGEWRLDLMNTDGSGRTLFLPAALKDVRFGYDFAAERVVSWGR